MTDFMTGLRSRYGVIVVDTPPLARASMRSCWLRWPEPAHRSAAGKDRPGISRGQDRPPASVAGAGVGTVLNDVRDGSEYRAYTYYMDGYELTGEPLFRPLVGGTKRAGPPVTARQ